MAEVRWWAVCLLPLLLWMGGSEAKAYGTNATLTSTPASPMVFDGTSTFTLTVTVASLNPNSIHTVMFFQHDPLTAVNTLLESQTSQSSDGTGHLSTTSSALAQPGQGTFLFFARVSEDVNPGVNTLDTPMLSVAFLGISQVTAEHTSRILPTLRATVEGIPPATPALVAGVVVDFEIAEFTVCSAVTNASGVATCHLLGVVIGPDTYTARFVGNDRFLLSNDSAEFFP